VLAQPVALLAPVWAPPLDELPESPRVVGHAQVAELVHDHVVEHLERRKYEPEGCQNEVHLRCGFVVLVYEAAEAVAAVDMAAAG
jgi:hypothetical protein